MRVGIICAMRMELELLLGHMEQTRRETAAGLSFILGQIAGKEVACAVCGPGKVNSALCAQALLERYAPQQVLNTGVAGALAPGLKPLSVVVADSVCQHDVDTTGLGDALGMVSGINRIQIEADPVIAAGLEAAALRTGSRAVRGIIATGDQFVSSSGRKREIRDSFGALAVEMEGGSIGQVCLVNGAPFGVLRVISDGGDENAQMSYEAFAQAAADHSARILLQYLKDLRP